jgi:hypothetical protein
VKLPGREVWEHKVILGVLWSSLSRYFFFLTAANWGNWHHEIKLHDELLTLPIRLPDDKRLRDRLIAIVDKLRCYDPPVPILDGIDQTLADLERQLDDTVFEMYGLAEPEIDLVRDMCEIGIDFFYNRDKSDAVQPVASRQPCPRTGDVKTKIKGPLGDYLRVFIQSWAAYLDTGTELHWEVHVSPKSDSMLAVVFTVHDTGDAADTASVEDRGWDDVLLELDKSMRTKVSSRIYIEGLARSVSDKGIIIIKRNERRLWTKSAAREDAEAVLVQAMRRDSLIRDKSS